MLKKRFASLFFVAAVLLGTLPAAAQAPQPNVVVDIDNWLSPEVNAWAFQNTTTFVPAAVVSRGATPSVPLEFAPANLGHLPYQGLDDGKAVELTVDAYLARTHTDAFLVMHRGKVVFERYFNGMSPQQRHIMMSVTKSFIGTVAAMLAADGTIDPAKKVTDYVPELAGTLFETRSVRDVMNMTAAVVYSEVYDDPKSDVWTYLYSIGLRKPPDGFDGPKTIGDYIATMKPKGKVGEHFEYVTPMSELLRWIVEKASGQDFPNLLSERIWSKIGAEHDAMILTEASNKALAGSGLFATTRDLARFGQMLVQYGTYNDRQIIPPAVVRGFIEGGDREAFKAYATEGSFKGFSYRDQWWVTHNKHNSFTALGVFGQIVYVDPTASMVIVKQSSLPEAVPEFADKNDFRVFQAIAEHLMAEN